MAVKTYSTTNISWSSTDDWANEIASNSNISVSGSATSFGDDLYPATGASNIKISEQLYNNKVFYGTMYTKTDIAAQVTLPYTGDSLAQSSNQVIKNCSYNDNATVRLVATATYPKVFQKWTSDAAGSTTISTNATLNLTDDDHTGVTTFYCWSTTA